MLKLQNLQVTSRRYAMHPLQSQISVDMAGGRAFIDRMGDVGHNCELGVSRLDTALESLMSKATNLQLVGLVHEGGMVLRNWRMEAAGEFAPTKRGQICGWTMYSDHSCKALQATTPGSTFFFGWHWST